MSDDPAAEATPVEAEPTEAKPAETAPPAPPPAEPVDTGYTPSGVPTFESVREKIETRYGTAIGAAELDAESTGGPHHRGAVRRASASRRRTTRRDPQVDAPGTGRRSVIRLGGQNFGQERVGGMPVQSRPREVPDPLARLR